MKLHSLTVFIAVTLSLVSSHVHAQTSAGEMGRIMIIGGSFSTSSSDKQSTKKLGWWMIGLGSLVVVAADNDYKRHKEQLYNRSNVNAALKRDCNIAMTTPDFVKNSDIAAIANSMDLFTAVPTEPARLTALCTLYKNVYDTAQMARAGDNAYGLGLAYKVAGTSALSDQDERVIHNLFVIQGVN